MVEITTTKIDGRTHRGKELNKRKVYEQMPKVYYVHDASRNEYRVGRTDWPGDAFTVVPKEEFDAFCKVYRTINMLLIDFTDSDGSKEDEELLINDAIDRFCR